MGFRSFATRLLSCCDDQVQPPRMVIGSPYGFTHVGGAEILVDPSVHEKSPSRTQNTGIEAFLANRRLAASTSSVQNTLRQHAKKLSDAMRCSLYSNNEGGVKQEDEEGLVAREADGGDCGEDGEEWVGHEDGGKTERTSSAETVVDPDGEEDHAYTEGSFISDHDEDGSNIYEIGHTEPIEIVEAKTATVVSMKRYGSTDLLALVDGSHNEGQ